MPKSVEAAPCRRAHQKIKATKLVLKYNFREVLPEVSSKIDRGALQDVKKPTRNENERSKNAKCGWEAPKSEK